MADTDSPSTNVPGQDHAQPSAGQARLVQSERMAAMAKLAAGVAHEINNPAGVLLMKLKFLLSIAGPESLSERAISTLHVAVEQTERIERIVESLLEFSRPSDGSLHAVQVNDVVALAVEAAVDRARTENVALRCEPAAGLAAVLADAAELQNVVAHLLDNALDAAGSAGTVIVRTGRTDDAICIDVEDDGAGIPDDFRERIFDPFFSTKRAGEGTGLGLAISFGLVQKFGGSIHVHSVRRQGTTMTVTLPALTEDHR